MRPLALINTIRKVWVSIILRKITTTWEQHNILSAGAHGGRPGRGTTSATLPFINMCEHSIQTGQPRYIQSFDMKKAFDTLSPAVKMMGWRRLGVPGHIAQYLVNMDIGGGYMVRRPETERLWAEFNGDIARMQTIPGATFQHQLGSPQGDVVSPAIWIAVFDILVRALETDAAAVQADYDSFRADEAADQAGKGISTLDQAYIDDLITQAATAEEIQAKADLISAFTCVFGITFSVAKLRRMVLNPADEGSTTPFVVHLQGWEAYTINTASTDKIVNLGATYDAVLSGKADLDEVVRYLARATAKITACRATYRAKQEVLESHVI